VALLTGTRPETRVGFFIRSITHCFRSPIHFYLVRQTVFSNFSTFSQISYTLPFLFISFYRSIFTHFHPVVPVLNYVVCILISFGVIKLYLGLCTQIVRNFFVSTKNLLEVTVTSSANRPTILIHVFSFFGQRVINVWNSLPDCVDFRSLTSFKRSILLVNFNHFKGLQIFM